MDVRVKHVCDECGEEYRRAIVSPDDRQDLAEGRRVGFCDQCWLKSLIEMHEGGN